MEWQDRKSVVNRLYKLVRMKLGTPKKEAQDEVLMAEQVLFNTSSTAKEYRGRIIKLIDEIKTYVPDNTQGTA